MFDRKTFHVFLLSMDGERSTKNDQRWTLDEKRWTINDGRSTKIDFYNLPPALSPKTPFTSYIRLKGCIN
jgi:hypothetical protein